MEKIRIGITSGDINGIGLEVIIKSLLHEAIFHDIIPILYSNVKIASYHKNIVSADSASFYVLNPGEKPKANKINIINCWNENVTITLGKATPEGGKFAILALEKAVEDALKGELDAIVTAPINKQAMHLAGFEHLGHTDYLKEKSAVKDVLMIMASDKLKIGLLTTHIPIHKVVSSITKEGIIKKIEILEVTLRKDFGFEKPSIAVLGLNPHAGEEGLLGSEEEEIIRPAIIEAKKRGLFVAGPYPADGFFGSGQFKKFDAILAMYHDQGLIPFKTISFEKGVNYTAGLPFVRTSPDHGTAYDLAGKNEADASSMTHALFMARDAVMERLSYDDMRKNVLRKRPKLSEEMSE